MVENSMEYIRRDAIAEIKEKIKKNPKCVHPCSKEFQEDMKRLRFENGNKYISWMQQNGILKSPVNINREYTEKKIKNAGCKTTKEYEDKCAKNIKDSTERRKERVKEWRHETGRCLPGFNEDCSVWFGDFTESLMIQTFEGAIRMPYGNPGFDWICKRGDKIDNKGACLCRNKWIFPIRHNNIADWFILSAWDNRDSLKPLRAWAFHKDDMARYGIGRGYILKKFCDRETFTIPNTPEGLKEFEKYEITNRLEK